MSEKSDDVSEVYVQESLIFDAEGNNERLKLTKTPKRSVFDDAEGLNETPDVDEEDDAIGKGENSTPDDLQPLADNVGATDESSAGRSRKVKLTGPISFDENGNGRSRKANLTKSISAVNLDVGDLFLEMGEWDYYELDSSLLDLDDLSEADERGQSSKDFFEELGAVPAVDDISLDSSMGEDGVVRRRRRGLELTGHYADPLTGARLPSEDSLLRAAEVSRADTESRKSEGETEFEEEMEEQFSELKLPSSSEDGSVPEEGVAETVTVTDKMLENFLHITPGKEDKLNKHIDFDAIERFEKRVNLLRDIENFINDIMDRAVERSEYIDPNEHLRNHLDIVKLYNEFKRISAQIFMEKRVNEFVNRQAVVYFRRKKMFRAIMEDASSTFDMETEKLETSLNQLDVLLGRSEITEKKATALLAELEKDAEVWEAKTKAEIKSLHDFMRQSILHQPSERLAIVLHREFKHMASLRQEISDVRYRLIQRQHTIATLEAHKAKLDTIGPNLMMNDFENLQRETISFDKKIEERNLELMKLQLRYHSDLHVMANVRETQKMLSQGLDRQHYVLFVFQLEKQVLRERIHDLKLDRSRLRAEIRELSFQGGLIGKPALMQDYDSTVERLDCVRGRVDKMRARLSDLQKKLSTAESYES